MRHASSEAIVFWSVDRFCQLFGGQDREVVSSTLSSGTDDHSRLAGGRRGGDPVNSRLIAVVLVIGVGV